MNKIITGLLGLVMVAAVVGGTAYALFSSTATVSGINISAGSAGIEVGSNNGNTTTNFNAGLNLSNLYPGYQNTTTFVVKNTSTANIALAVKAQLTAAGNWDQLADAVEVAVDADAGSTGWQTLRTWNAAPINFPGLTVAQNGFKTYTVYVRVPLNYSAGTPLAGNPVGNEISGQSLNNVTFTLTGTQSL